MLKIKFETYEMFKMFEIMFERFKIRFEMFLVFEMFEILFEMFKVFEIIFKKL